MIILWNVKTAHVNRKEPIQNFGSFFISLYGFITAKFSHKIIQFNNNGLTTFQDFLLPLIFLVCDIKAFSLTFSQKCYTQVSLFIGFTLIFLSPIFEKNIPKLCSLHGCFWHILLHKRRMITSDEFLFSRSLLIKNFIAEYLKVINVLITIVLQILWNNLL